MRDLAYVRGRELDVEPARSIAAEEFRSPRRRRQRSVAEAVLDALVLGLAALAGSIVGSTAWVALSVALAAGLLAASGYYTGASRRSIGGQLRWALAATAVAVMVVIALRAGLAGDAPAGDLAVTWLAASVGLVGARLLLAALKVRRWVRGVAGRRVLVVGAGQVSRAAARRLGERPVLGMQPIGFLDLEPLEGDGRDPEVLGASWDLERVVRDHQVDAVLVGFSTAPHPVMLRTIRRCWELGLEVMLVPRLFEVHGVGTATQHVGGLPIVRLRPHRRRRIALTIKHAVERLLAVLILAVLAPAMALIGLLVKLTSNGPVLHRAQRVGENGRPFEMLKFRTMPGGPQPTAEADAEWAEAALRDAAAQPEQIAKLPARRSDSDEWTAIGRFLRRTALDELPQLWNVARGDMALVGPRPERVTYAERFATAIHRYDERHRFRPGMTGWAQVQGLRGKTSLTDRVEWDNFYIENWSLSFDLKILALTIVAIWRHDVC